MIAPRCPPLDRAALVRRMEADDNTAFLAKQAMLAARRRGDAHAEAVARRIHNNRVLNRQALWTVIEALDAGTSTPLIPAEAGTQDRSEPVHPQEGAAGSRGPFTRAAALVVLGPGLRRDERNSKNRDERNNGAGAGDTPCP